MHVIYRSTVVFGEARLARIDQDGRMRSQKCRATV